MKRLFVVLFALLMVLSLFACSKNSDSNDATSSASDTQKGDGTTTIVRKDSPDPDLLRAWKADSDGAPYIVFTDSSTIRIIKGASALESEVSYGEDGLGNKSIATDCSEFRGQSVYTVEDGVLTIIHPVIDSEGNVTGYENLIYNAANEFKPVSVQPKENFKADDALIGVWTNSLTGESYEFTEDGYLIATVYNFNGNVETYIIENTYTADNGVLNIYTVVDSDNNEVSKEMEYEIDGTMLLLNGSADYYLNGEGDPNSSFDAE